LRSAARRDSVREVRKDRKKKKTRPAKRRRREKRRKEEEEEEKERKKPHFLSVDLDSTFKNAGARRAL